MNLPWIITSVVIGGCLSIVGGLIVFNLQSIKKCLASLSDKLSKQDAKIDSHADKIATLETSQANCKTDCFRSFVSSEAFLRETGFQRRSMEKLTNAVSRLDGKLTVVEKLPQICGDISREIVKEMKNGAPK